MWLACLFAQKAKVTNQKTNLADHRVMDSMFTTSDLFALKNLLSPEDDSSDEEKVSCAFFNKLRYLIPEINMHSL